MDARLLLLIGIMSAAILLVLLGKHMAKRKIVAGRHPLSFEELHRLTDSQVSIQTVSKVLTMLGESYGLDPRLIRPDDRLKSFFDLDSWTLGAGTERINNWLAQQGVAGHGANLVTVLDLIFFLERYKN